MDGGPLWEGCALDDCEGSRVGSKAEPAGPGLFVETFKANTIELVRRRRMLIIAKLFEMVR
ncbi:hypothetical protein KEJ17_02400 [Candidatus Bathyarchaeota archaeon]|nr:hypothetical protein [Candidatus Bathyarchaeota archaeon]